jgi:hypothetical protein
MLRLPAAAPTTSSTPVGANISAANATGTAKYAAIIGPTVPPPPKLWAILLLMTYRAMRLKLLVGLLEQHL